MLERCPGAAAIYFTRVMKCIIQDVFGWARYQYGPSFNDDLLPMVEAYSMAVENDTSQSLHLHCLVWCIGETEILDRLNWYSLCETHRNEHKPTSKDFMFDYKRSSYRYITQIYNL